MMCGEFTQTDSGAPSSGTGAPFAMRKFFVGLKDYEDAAQVAARLKVGHSFL